MRDQAQGCDVDGQLYRCHSELLATRQLSGSNPDNYTKSTNGKWQKAMCLPKHLAAKKKHTFRF
jgi:hypothetical protein